MAQEKLKRILLIDDSVEIHEDFRKILLSNTSSSLNEEEAILFGSNDQQNVHSVTYRLDSAYQGQEALLLIQKSLLENDPYALAFVDMRMPPGWDGVETIKRIWEVDPSIQMVICSAYSDHSWEDISQELGHSDNLIILKKPFEVIEITQLAMALTKKWELVAHLHTLVKNRTSELEHLHALTQATLEATEEGILAVGLNQKVLIHNDNFLKQWEIKKEEVTGNDANTLFDLLAKKVENPAHFVAVMNKLSDEPKSQDNKEWQLKSGYILELYTEPQYLHGEIIGVVYSFRDITERKAMETQLLHQATHDILTGLPNRALLQDRINQTLVHAKRFNLLMGVLLVDLDHFKEVNDTFGHNTGDALLKAQADKLSSFVRENDTVARLGGDEFVVVLASEPNEQYFSRTVQKLLELFVVPCHIDGHDIVSTVSIGVSIYPKDGQDATTLLKNADAALYHSKESGRNRFQFYLEQFNQLTLEHAEIQTALSQALQKNELSLDYQPLLDLKSGKIIGIEALLRWHHPTLGNVLPEKFLPVAEESGLILPIGEWVLKTACAQTKIWHDTSAFPNIKISVNISPKQFHQKSFATILSKILKETGIKPESLELEVAENLMMEKTEEVREKMKSLKALGIRFAIDDFGRGYFSLNNLKHFPFDTVKIDKIFMSNVVKDADHSSIVKAIIGMTKKMGVGVLAEGVEDKEQVDFLRKHHGQEVQGYYFSKPLSQQACTELLNKYEDDN